MLPTHSGSFRLFRVAGIQVYLHWWWFVFAVFEISLRGRAYSSLAWNAAEYVSLFLIVLLHEFGHSLACRSVGGKADEIILWPLGGIAFVRPPPRAGAELWSIAAGPLVNVVLIPVIYGLMWLRITYGWGIDSPDLGRLLKAVFVINISLLVFNMVPVYPLDGGQILRSLLWFAIGRARSLQVASIVGFIAIPLLAAVLILRGIGSPIFTGLIALFLFSQCMTGYRHAKALLAIAQLPRHRGVGCPTCREAPPGGPLWGCQACNNRFDPFSTRAVCPHCGAVLPKVTCAHCGSAHPIERWETTAPRRPGDPPVIEV